MPLGQSAPQVLTLGLPSGYEVEHLTRLFYPTAKPRANKEGAERYSTKGFLVYARAGKYRMAAALRDENGGIHLSFAPLPKSTKDKKVELCRLVYGILKKHTGLRPPWGMLTGVRPVNYLRRQTALLGDDGAEQYFKEVYDVSPEKYALAKEILSAQAPVLAKSGKNSYSLYISIPFCPTRCAYCSFVSRTTRQEGHLVQPYLQKLAEELALTANTAAEAGLNLETIYIGGGTPTALDENQLEALLKAVQKNFNTAAVREYTVEAGRPDCTGQKKLELLKQYGVTRISINPQTLNNDVLKEIGRMHTAVQTLECFANARKAGHNNINMDLIAGLPADTPQSFDKTLKQIIALSPESITLHSLTLKRASDIAQQGAGKHAHPAQMLAQAYPRLRAAGYAPYYLYRQKSGVDNLENTGWARQGGVCEYNIYIMEEAHTILAAGAGGSTKLVAPGGAKIERIYNHKYPVDYITRHSEITARKRGVTQFYAGYLDT